MSKELLCRQLQLMKSQVLGDPVTWLVLHPVSEKSLKSSTLFVLFWKKPSARN